MECFAVPSSYSDVVGCDLDIHFYTLMLETTLIYPEEIYSDANYQHFTEGRLVCNPAHYPS